MQKKYDLVVIGNGSSDENKTKYGVDFLFEHSNV